MTNKIVKNVDGTYSLVSSVEEAALVLDLDKPNWYNLINLETFDCARSEVCICRQVYNEEWPKSLHRIFGKEQYESDPHNYVHNTRNIFAGSTDKWKYEILKRRNSMNSIGTFGWAMLQLRNGKFVYEEESFTKGIYLSSSQNKIYQHDNLIEPYELNIFIFTEKQLLSKGWKIYNKPTYLDDVKPGQKFQFKIDPEVTYVKAILGSDCLKDNVYFSLKTHMVHQTNQKTEVVIIEENKS